MVTVFRRDRPVVPIIGRTGYAAHVGYGNPHDPEIVRILAKPVATTAGSHLSADLEGIGLSTRHVIVR